MNCSSQKSTLIVITGPTAVGKTALCVKIAQHFNTEIISADSRQFFKELAIGTAKPTNKEMQNIKHHFVHSHSITENFNVNDFEKDSLLVLENIFKTNKIVILTGGSGLYIDALCNGFDEELPGNDTSVRLELEGLYNKYGIEILQTKLQQLDPEFYKEIDLKNVKRLQRAIEVCLLSGKKYSDIRQGNKQQRPFNIIKIGLIRDRTELFERINKRVDVMMQQGLLEEAKSVVKYKANNSLKTVGYTELFDYFEGKIKLEEAIEKIKVNTRRYAKRQLAWFNKNEDYKWFNPDDFEIIKNYISSKIK